MEESPLFYFSLEESIKSFFSMSAQAGGFGSNTPHEGKAIAFSRN
ncbi:hypothetical protein [Bacillus sp. Marseille-Q3570]|nr:hypothetical protein [Bacillus sp. Marseille-Q3570]